MNKVPDWLKYLTGVIVLLAGWIFAFAKDQGASEVEFQRLKEDVKEIQDQLKTYNIAVLSNDLQHLSENVKKNNDLLKEFNDFLRDLKNGGN